MTGRAALYKIETHLHTSETSPCARVGAADIIALYKQKGYSCVIVTDHYSMRTFLRMFGKSWDEKTELFLKGYREAKKAGDAIGLKVLLGIELTFNYSINDFLVYGMEEDFLKKNPGLCSMSLAKFSGLAHKNNLLIYQAHPYRMGMSRANPKYLDGIEVYNAHPRHNSRNDRAHEFARKNGLLMSSGSDMHRMEDAARGGMLLPELPENNADLIRVLRQNSENRLITS